MVPERWGEGMGTVGPAWRRTNKRVTAALLAVVAIACIIAVVAHHGLQATPCRQAISMQAGRCVSAPVTRASPQGSLADLELDAAASPQGSLPDSPLQGTAVTQGNADSRVLVVRRTPGPGTARRIVTTHMFDRDRDEPPLSDAPTLTTFVRHLATYALRLDLALDMAVKGQAGRTLVHANLAASRNIMVTSWHFVAKNKRTLAAPAFRTVARAWQAYIRASAAAQRYLSGGGNADLVAAREAYSAASHGFLTILHTLPGGDDGLDGETNAD